MPWITKLAKCNWCDIEINAICDVVHESVAGTLCERCEKARIEAREMYKEEDRERRVKRTLDNIVKELKNENEAT